MCERAGLQLADAVFGAEAAIQGRDVFVDDRVDCRLAGVDAGSPVGAEHVVVQVAIAKVAERDDPGIRESRFERRAALGEELRQPADRQADVVLDADPLVPLRLGGLDLGFTNAALMMVLATTAIAGGVLEVVISSTK